MATENDHALVINASIMHGFVAAKCNQHALQVMGIDVCCFITHNFFHRDWKMLNSTVEDLQNMYSTLKEAGLTKRYTHIITGFAKDKEMWSAIVEIVKDLKASNPDIIYVCDPIYGDNGKRYVHSGADGLGDIIKDVLIPLSDITTPNQFEVELLSDMKIETEEDALQAIQRVHDKGPNIVIMSSSTIDGKDVLTSIGSQWKDGKREAYKIEFPHIDAYLIGTGDLFIGSFTGLMRKTGDFKSAFEKTISIMQLVCQRTIREAKERAGPGNPVPTDMLDLRVAQCTSFIMDPQILYPSTKIV